MWSQRLHWNVIVWNYVQLKCFWNKNSKQSNCREGGRALLKQQASHTAAEALTPQFPAPACPQSQLPALMGAAAAAAPGVLPQTLAPEHCPHHLTSHYSQGFPQTYSNIFYLQETHLKDKNLNSG